MHILSGQHESVSIAWQQLWLELMREPRLGQFAATLRPMWPTMKPSELVALPTHTRRSTTPCSSARFDLLRQ
jgi:hypothetical protein